MREMMNNCSSSQKSSHLSGQRIKELYNSSYTSMLLEDITISNSLTFRTWMNQQQFYRAEPEAFGKLLCDQYWSSFDRDMDSLLRSIAFGIVYSDHAFLELVTYRDDTGSLKRISFVPIVPLLHFSGGLNTYFLILVNAPGRLRLFRVPNKSLIAISSKELGLSRFYFRTLTKRLKQLDPLRTVDLAISSNKNGFDFSSSNRKNDLLLLKITREIGWFGRKPDNQHMSKSYLSFRIIQFKNFQRKLLQYSLKKINSVLQINSKELGVTGRIIANYSNPQFEAEFSKLTAGKVNLSLLNKKIFKV